MALSINTVWELRDNGNDGNGGGFVTGASGTDFSQQAAAQASGTDLTSVSSLVVSSASHNFVAADVGNLIQITTATGSGWTAGFYQIVSVAANQATLDRSPGTVGVSGTWGMGGALLTHAKVKATATIGHVVHMKGSFTITAAISTDGNATGRRFTGYTTTRGDNGRITITTATNSISMISMDGSNSGDVWENVSFTTTAGTKGKCITVTGNAAAGIVFRNCVIDGFTIGINSDGNSGGPIRPMLVESCEIKNCTSQGIVANGSTTIYGCYIHDNTSDGIKSPAVFNSDKPIVVIRSVIKSNGGKGINISANSGPGDGCPIIINSVIMSNTSDGLFINAASSFVSFVLINCIIISNGGWGVMVNNNSTTGIPIFATSHVNAYFNNTSGAKSTNFTAGVNRSLGSDDITLTGDPFTSSGTGDFTLNSTAGAGASCKAVGFESSII